MEFYERQQGSQREYAYTKVGEQEIKVEVSYNKGGYSFLSGYNTTRGYYLSATPVTRKDGFESSMAYSGYRVFLQEAARFNIRVLRFLAAKVFSYPPQDLKAMIDKALEVVA